jgi:Cof subfamily protein (haloacid dehalogenase superfamily)
MAMLVAVDLDGTLLTSEGTLAPESARLLRKATQDGVHVVLATTRNPDSVRPFCRLLEINEPIICTNGAQVWGSPDGPVWAYHSIPQEVGLAIAQLADTHDWELSTTVGSATYWRQRPGQALGPIAPNITVVASNSDAIVDNPVRILTWHPDAVDSVRSLCQSKFTNQCYTETYYRPDGTVHSLGVFALQANKGAALALVLNRLGLKSQQVIAMGDNFNDLPMFAHARVSVAMFNAPDEVKQQANAVAPSNDEEGVAWALTAYGVV